MTGPGCEELRASAAEVALGVLDGEDRARALEHARGCPACRAHLAELAVVGAAFLETAPAREPPPGFESRVLDALPAPRTSPRRLRRLLPALAAACALVAGSAVVTLSATRSERDLGAYYQAVLARAGGTYLTAWELRDRAGERRGVVFAYQGDQSWLTVVLATGGGSWRVAIATRDGAQRDLGRFASGASGRAWGHELPVSVRSLASVRLTGADGRVLVAKRPQSPNAAGP